jgi:hypothetical protein
MASSVRDQVWSEGEPHFFVRRDPPQPILTSESELQPNAAYTVADPDGVRFLDFELLELPFQHDGDDTWYVVIRQMTLFKAEVVSLSEIGLTPQAGVTIRPMN